jgi:signal transduction histidine kinase
VVLNIAGNAVEHAALGGTVEVALRYEAEPRSVVVLTVRDDGSGFATADLPRVFEPFFSRRPGGSGLGLAIAHKAVVEHGGEVHAGNAPGGGGLLEVRLPARAGGDGA